MVLSEKETLLLKDLMNAEELCIQKYSRGVNEAKDAALSRLCSEIEAAESTHLQTLTDISNGNAPQMNASSGKSQQKDESPKPVSTGKAAPSDAFLCNDLLTAEKNASALYDTGIFEFRENATRSALNHIQKEEQEHGKKLYDYMTAHAIYG